MEISQPPMFSFDSKGDQEMSESANCSISLWSKLWEAQAKRRLKVKKQRMMSSREKVRHVRCRRARRRHVINPFEKKLKTLKKLIPNNNESRGLDGVFEETAEYILCLQMRIKLMQIMVKVLTD